MALNHLWENLLDMKSLSHWIISFMTLLDHHLFSTVRLEFSKRQNFEKMTNFNRRKSVFKDSVKRGKNLYGSHFTFNSPLTNWRITLIFKSFRQKSTIWDHFCVLWSRITIDIFKIIRIQNFALDGSPWHLVPVFYPTPQPNTHS